MKSIEYAAVVVIASVLAVAVIAYSLRVVKLIGGLM